MLLVFFGCYRVVPFVSIHQCPSTFISCEGGDLDLEESYLGDLRLGRCPDEVYKDGYCSAKTERNKLRSERVGSFFSLRVYLVKVSASNCRSIPLDFRVNAFASPQMSTIHVTMSCRKRECCNIPGPPYCVSSTGSQVARAFAGHPEKSSC